MQEYLAWVTLPCTPFCPPIICLLECKAITRLWNEWMFEKVYLLCRAYRTHLWIRFLVVKYHIILNYSNKWCFQSLLIARLDELTKDMKEMFEDNLPPCSFLYYFISIIFSLEILHPNCSLVLGQIICRVEILLPWQGRDYH